MNLEEKITAFTLKNALDHGGKAQPGAVLGHLLSCDPSLKKDVPGLMPQINEIVSRINSLDQGTQQAALSETGMKFEKKEERGKTLPEIQFKDKLRVRFAPSPSGPLHIGHTRAIILNAEYAKKYDGEFILRIEDTNPNNILPEAYDWIPDAIRWLGYKPDKTILQSDNIISYYKYAHKLIEEGNAYVCECPPTKFKKLIDSKKSCPCRRLGPKKQLSRWEDMFDTYKEGKAVLRIKTDVKDPNPAIRDWPAMRIIDAPHPRTGTKYRVWPLYNFSCAIDDHEFGITYILRGKDHIVNRDRQAFLFRHLGWKFPPSYHYGRLKIGESETELSTTKTKAKIDSGKLSGWDDPALATLRSLRKRGIQPDAIKQLILSLGITRVDSSLSWKTLYSLNTKIIEPEANRYFFVPNPERIQIKSSSPLLASPLLHPNFPARGTRNFKLLPKNGVITLYAPKTDIRKKFRLLNLCNVQKDGGKYSILPDGMLAKKVQWLPEGPPCRIYLQNGKILEGICEASLASLKPGTMVQFVRIGYARYDRKEGGTLVFYLAH